MAVVLVLTLLLIVDTVRSATFSAPQVVQLHKRVATSEKRADVSLTVDPTAAFSWDVPITVGVSSTETFYLALDTGSTDLLIYSNSCPTQNDQQDSGCPGTIDWDPTSDGSTQVQCGNSAVPGCVSSNSAAAFCGSGSGSTVGACSIIDKFGGGSVATSNGYLTTVNFPGSGGSPVQNVFAASIVSLTGPGFGPSGLVGFAKKGLSSAGVDPVSLKYMNGNNMYAAFTLLLSSNLLLLGQNDHNLAGMNFITSTGSFWTIPTTAIIANGQSLSLGATTLPIIIDSGTSGIFLSTSLYQQTRNAFAAVCNTNPTLPGLCINNTDNLDVWDTRRDLALTQAQVDAYPSFSFTFGGVQYAIDGNQYLFQGKSGGYQIVFVQSTGSSNLVAGACFMQKYRFNFDYTTNTVGLSEANNCNTISSCVSIDCATDSDVSQCLKCATSTFLVSNYPTSSDTCNACPTIQNCATVNCTNATFAKCFQANNGFYVVSNAGSSDTTAACTPVGNCTSSITCTSPDDSQCTSCSNNLVPNDSGDATVCSEDTSASVNLVAGVGAILLLLIAYLV